MNYTEIFSSRTTSNENIQRHLLKLQTEYRRIIWPCMSTLQQEQFIVHKDGKKLPHGSLRRWSTIFPVREIK